METSIAINHAQSISQNMGMAMTLQQRKEQVISGHKHPITPDEKKENRKKESYTNSLFSI